MSIYDEPNPDGGDAGGAPQAPIMLQRGAGGGAPRSQIARLVWNAIVVLLLFIALLMAVAGGVLLGGAGGGLLAAAVCFAYFAHLIDSAA